MGAQIARGRHFHREMERRFSLGLLIEPTDDLRGRILKFIDYSNRTMAKPYKWTYAGRPLKV